METNSFIKIYTKDNYTKANIKLYHELIEKLIYLLYGIRSAITFTIRKFNKYNTDLSIKYFKATK